MRRLLTYSIVQSPSWEANWFAASQEIPRISRDPKVHYRTHKSPPPVPILVQPNPVHTPTSHLLQIHPNIIQQSTPRYPHWSLSLRFPHQDPIHPPLLTHTHHMPSPSHSSRFYHPHNIGWGVQIIYEAIGRKKCLLASIRWWTNGNTRVVTWTLKVLIYYTVVIISFPYCWPKDFEAQREDMRTERKTLCFFSRCENF